MLRRCHRFFCSRLRDAAGGVSVEFAVIGTVFILLVCGILDFGHAWYMKQIVTNASREGARYGVMYQFNPATNARKPPNTFNPTIKDYVLNNYLAKTSLPANAKPDVTPAGTGYTTGTKGAPVEVTVTATKTWFILSGLVPGLGSQKTLKATTVMQCE